MIKAAFNGVAMINGRNELKNIAKYVSFKVCPAIGVTLNLYSYVKSFHYNSM